jgi:hypothetical protein
MVVDVVGLSASGHPSSFQLPMDDVTTFEIISTPYDNHAKTARLSEGYQRTACLFVGRPSCCELLLPGGGVEGCSP